MKYGICICGLNGSGKTTLASALAKKLNFKHMDVEEYYFTSADNPYQSSRSREEVEQLLLEDIKLNPCFVFSAVNGDMTTEINAHYDMVIYLDVPVDMRIKRIRQRAIDKFGNRVLFGGDMYEQEEKFFEYAEKRKPDKIEEWLNTMVCKCIRLDGTKPKSESIKTIVENMQVIKGALV